MMKIYKYLAIVLVSAFLFFSCNEQEWLKEEPLDFFSADISYVTAAQFNSAVARLYNLNQDYTIFGGIDHFFTYTYVSDVAFRAKDPGKGLNPIQDAMVPSAGVVNTNWKQFYKIVTNLYYFVFKMFLFAIFCPYLGNCASSLASMTATPVSVWSLLVAGIKP